MGDHRSPLASHVVTSAGDGRCQYDADACNAPDTSRRGQHGGRCQYDADACHAPDMSRRLQHGGRCQYDADVCNVPDTSHRHVTLTTRLTTSDTHSPISVGVRHVGRPLLTHRHVTLTTQLTTSDTHSPISVGVRHVGRPLLTHRHVTALAKAAPLRAEDNRQAVLLLLPTRAHLGIWEGKHHVTATQHG